MNLTSVLLIRQSDSGAPVCTRESTQKVDTLNTNLASSFRPLFVGHSYLFSKGLQRLPTFIVDFRSCLCDRIDFWPAVFYTVCAASHLKGVMVKLASLDMSQVTNVRV